MEPQTDIMIEINRFIQLKIQKTEKLLIELAGDRILDVKCYSQPSHDREWFKLDGKKILEVLLTRKNSTIEYTFIRYPKGE